MGEPLNKDMEDFKNGNIPITGGSKGPLNRGGAVRRQTAFLEAEAADYTLSNIIKLVEQKNYGRTRTGGLGVKGQHEFVAFKVQPELSESKSVNYIEISEIRSPGSIMVFIGSPARNFSMEVKLISRSIEEAQQNFRILHTLKGWSMPDKAYSSHDSLGAGEIDSGTPRILKLFGYGKNFKGIPVVIKSLNVSYPVDCDYIDTGDVRMPVIMPISIQLQEMRSSVELEKFDISMYREGELPTW